MTSRRLYSLDVWRIESSADVVAETCVLCGSDDARLTLGVQEVDAVVAVCAECGLGWLSPQPASDVINTFYPDEYYGGGGRKFAGLVEMLIRFVCGRHTRFLTEHLPDNGRVLDIGCGRGVLLKSLADRGYETVGFEVSAAAAAGLDSRVALDIAPSVIDVAYPDQHFDQVILWHVLEHLPDPAGVIDEAHRILKPGGALVIAVPNFSSMQALWSGPAWFHLDLPRHLYHFPIAGLRQLVEQSSFELRSEHHFSLRQNPFGWVQSALNKIPGLPRNGLYELLHHRRVGEPAPFDLPTRLCLRLAFAIGMPIGLMIELLATAKRSGATVHIVATKH